MTLDEQTREERKTKQVEVTAKYLPSTETFEQEFTRTATLGDVKTAVIAFFKVADFTDRDTHTFHLMYKDQQRDDLGTTLDALLDDKEHKAKAKFQLIEQIKAG
jgi:hypothetical protein